MNFDLVLGWSSRLGFHFSGSAGLEAELPINVSIGPVSIQSVHLAVRAGSDGIRNEIATTAGLEIGPVKVVVEQIGIAADSHSRTRGQPCEANLAVTSTAKRRRPVDRLT